MKHKGKRFPIRTILSVGNLFHNSRLEIMLLDGIHGSEMNAHYRVNPNSPYSDKPVLDELTLQVIERIFTIMSNKHNCTLPRLIVAGHIHAGYPKYYTNTYGSINAREVNNILAVVSKDVIKDYRSPNALAYIRRVNRLTRHSVELIKRVLNAWAIANLVLEDERHTLISLDEVHQYECRHPDAISLL